MIQKTKSQTKTPPSTGDKKAPTRNTVFPVFEKGPISKVHNRRKILYATSFVFKKELAAITSALINTSVNYRNDVLKFLKCFHPDRHDFMDIAARIADCPKPLRPALKHYVAFAFRFRVRLHGRRSEDGELLIEPVYEEISSPRLYAKLKKGALVPVENDDQFAESDKIGDHYDDFRSKLKLETGDEDEPESFRLLHIKIADSRNSELMRIVNTFYDPLALNFIDIERRVVGKQTQHYLMCIIGELSEDRVCRNDGFIRSMSKQLSRASRYRAK